MLGRLGGCVAEEPERERSDVPTNATAERLGSVARGFEQTSQGCDGTPLPSCDGPFTGAACDLPCALAPPGLPPLECGVDRYCHSDGSTYGVAARNAVLYPASPDEPDEIVQANLEAWIVEHPADLGLAAGLTAEDLELHRGNDFRSSAGALTIFRFTQTYRGIPVLAPDGIVTLVHGPQGAISISGAIIDGRTPYEHADAQVYAARAIDSILAHADAQLPQATVQGLRVEHATPVALPMRQAIGWAGFVRKHRGPLLARVIVDADPTHAGAVQPLWSFRELAIIFAHEFGHIVDLFTGGGLIEDFAPDCAGACDYECVADTTDEAPPLSESVAQLLAFVFLQQAFDGVQWQHCSIVDLVSRNGSKPWTPGSCIPPGEDISLLLRSGDCTKPSDSYCDRPEDAGIGRDCCYDDEDLTDCTLLVSDECPVGELGDSGGLGTGTARPEPTGVCDASPGYSTNSLFQAFWQMLNGQRCEPTPPFACVSVDWAPGVTPMDAATAALLYYAMRTNALTYDQLVDGMATYVSCNYGAAAYDELNAVACAHGLRDCAAQAPMICEDCGNDVREGSETCVWGWIRAAAAVELRLRAVAGSSSSPCPCSA